MGMRRWAVVCLVLTAGVAAAIAHEAKSAGQTVITGAEAVAVYHATASLDFPVSELKDMEVTLKRVEGGTAVSFIVIRPIYPGFPRERDSTGRPRTVVVSDDGSILRSYLHR